MSLPDVAHRIGDGHEPAFEALVREIVGKISEVGKADPDKGTRVLTSVIATICGRTEDPLGSLDFFAGLSRMYLKKALAGEGRPQ